MKKNFKNIIIFLVLAIIVVLGFLYFMNGQDEEVADLISQSDPVPSLDSQEIISGDFLSLLLSVRSIKLNDSIFEQNIFDSLRDSSVSLVPDGTEGRPNPFAPIGVDLVTPQENDTEGSQIESDIETSENTEATISSEENVGTDTMTSSDEEENLNDISGLEDLDSLLEDLEP